MTRAGGAALLLVLWLIALLTALVGAYALTARIEGLQGRTEVDGLAAREAARAGIEYALTRLASNDPAIQWVPDGRAYRWRFGQAVVAMEIADESGKVDLNAADATLLSNLFRAIGEEPDRAARLASAIVDWRDPDSLTQPQGGAEDADYGAAGLPYGAADMPFATVAEVEQVLGMTPTTFARVSPFLTVFSGMPAPNPQFAPPQVLQAMGVDARQAKAGVGDGFVGGGTGTYSIRSQAQLPNRSRAALLVVVRSGGSGLPGSAYVPLRWEEGEAPR